jgi:perosamine synthetase
MIVIATSLPINLDVDFLNDLKILIVTTEGNPLSVNSRNHSVLVTDDNEFVLKVVQISNVKLLINVFSAHPLAKSGINEECILTVEENGDDLTLGDPANPIRIRISAYAEKHLAVSYLLHRFLKTEFVPSISKVSIRPLVSDSFPLTKPKKFRMNEPLIGPNSLKYLEEVLESTWLGVEGPFVKRLESMFGDLCCGLNQGHAVAVNSGTAALYGALKALGVKEKTDYVICPAYTCAACADAVVHAGGTPLIADCELETFGLSAESVLKSLERYPNKIVGVIVAPCYGVPARDLVEISRICKERGIFLIEDNCESYGAITQYNGKRIPVGSIGDLSVVSIRSEKMVGVGEGGLIISKSKELIEEARWWCSRAPTKGVNSWRCYQHDEVGMNYRLCEPLAAIGCAAFENLPLMILRKREIRKWYEEFLGMELQNFNRGDDLVWWINAVILPESLKGKAESIGLELPKRFPYIETRPGFYPLNEMKPFHLVSLDCPNARELHERVICLPSSAMLTKENVQEICVRFNEIVNEQINLVA